jgi:two-component system, OmpR family, sensor histidine kinase TctE
MADRSLRFGLLIRLSSALIVLLALDAVACYFTALYFANLVYDRWMMDDARSLAQAVHSGPDGKVRFDLPAVGLQVFQFDSIDKNYFRISSAQQGYIAGERDLPDPPPVEPGGTQIRYTTVDGQRVRQVSTRVIPPLSQDVVTIEIAETLMKRSTLAREILFGMAAPQVALLAFALVLAWLGVSRGLKPLTDLAAQIQSRDQNNLSPISHDVSPKETRVLVERINDLLGRLNSAIQAQKRFVADAAHQLRTPLAAVMLHAERAERAADTATEREALRALRKSTERAARLSQQLLSLARAEPEAAVVVDLKPVDLGALARRVGEEWIPRALEQDVDFGLIVPDEPVSIAGDDRLLAEMLSNLIDNALRYGGRSGHVTVIVEGGAIPKISVQDDGPGIPTEERQKIFERFYRVTGSTGEGCGLGLAIVQEIARLHRSTVEVSSGLDDRGSRFTVSFGAMAHTSPTAASA